MEGVEDPSNVSSLGLHQLCQPSSLIIEPHTLQLSNNLLDGILCVHMGVRTWSCKNEKNKNQSSYWVAGFNFSSSFNPSPFSFELFTVLAH